MSKSKLNEKGNINDQNVRNNVYVSIVIPCRNEENFIGQCLDSIVLNDYPKEKLEVIIVDGLSEDRTREIINKYIKKFSFIKLLENPRKTQQIALNIGIRHARGDIIIRMDAHCGFAKNYIQQCVQYLMKTDADNVGGRLITIDHNKTLIGSAIAFAMSAQFGVGNSSFRIRGRKEDGDPIWVDTVPYSCYRREVFDKVGLFNENLVRSEDAEFHLRMKEFGCRTLFVPAIVSYYYARSDLKAFWKHSINNGLWAILPTMYTGRVVVSLRHLVPLAFVSSLFVFGMLSLITETFLIPFLLVGGSYLLTNISFSIAAAFREKDIRFLFIMPLIFVILHIGYGLGSLVGLVRVVVSKLSKAIRSVGIRSE